MTDDKQCEEKGVEKSYFGKEKEKSKVLKEKDPFRLLKSSLS